ncbi:MAG: hypothetical protein LBI68_00945 [Azoarcus sp.]|jgi:hypothetical protein|nr:hypothetical protein [Azoarcus sp.]
MLDIVRAARTMPVMETVIETPIFQKQSAALWTEDEYCEFTLTVYAKTERKTLKADKINKLNPM